MAVTVKTVDMRIAGRRLGWVCLAAWAVGFVWGAAFVGVTEKWWGWIRVVVAEGCGGK